MIIKACFIQAALELAPCSRLGSCILSAKGGGDGVGGRGGLQISIRFMNWTKLRSCLCALFADRGTRHLSLSLSLNFEFGFSVCLSVCLMLLQMCMLVADCNSLFSVRACVINMFAVYSKDWPVHRSSWSRVFLDYPRVFHFFEFEYSPSPYFSLSLSLSLENVLLSPSIRLSLSLSLDLSLCVWPSFYFSLFVSL